ncbi:polysialyltransferase family glycosyltransferase [Providencia rettgeri]
MRILVGININSPYQLLSFLSYYEKNKLHYSKKIIYKFDYWGYNQIYNRYLNYFISEGGELIEEITDLDEIIKQLKSNHPNALFDFITINEPSIKLKFLFKKSKAIIIADGLGYYGNFLTTILGIKREKAIKISSKDKIFMALKYFTKKLIFHFIEYEEYTLLKYKNLKFNENFSDDLKKIIPKLKGKSDINKPSLIFSDQPLVKLKILSSNEYNRLINSVYVYATSLGLEFYIKEHPSHPISDSKYNIVKFDGIIEELCLVNSNIKQVLSYSSTGLFNLIYLRNDIIVEKAVKSYSLYMSKKQRKILDKINYYEK